MIEFVSDRNPRPLPVSRHAVLSRLTLLLSLLSVWVGVAAPRAVAADSLFIQGGGYGHGIGMSQYGAYGYALHGADYRSILEHYYQGTSIGTTSPSQIVKVLLATGQASFSGATAAGGKKLDPNTTYQVKALANGAIRLVPNSGKKLRGTFT